MIPNAPKYYETHRNISFGSNGVDWVCSLQKTGLDFVARTFALIAPVQPISHRVSCSNETIQNAPIHEFRVQWGGSGAFIAKNPDAISWHELLH